MDMSKDKASIEATGKPVVVVPFGEITIHGPSGDNVLLLVYDPITSGMVGIDASYVDQVSNIVLSPYAMHNNEMLISTKGRDIEHIEAPRFGQMIDQWAVKELSLSNIEALAEEFGISKDRITPEVLSDIVHSVEKGVDAALENWGDIVREAIEDSVPEIEDETED